MLLKTDAIVIQSFRHGEADIIAKLFTKEKGLCTYLVKGILKSKKGKIRSSFFQQMTILEIETTHKELANFNYLKDVKPKIHYKTLHTNIIKGSVVTFITEVLQQVIQGNQQDIELFNFIKKSLLWFDINEKSMFFHHLFLIKLMKYLGIYPENAISALNSIEIPYNSLDEKNLELLLGINFDTINNIKLPKNERIKLLENILQYYKFHQEGFKTPNSFHILQELFK